MFLQLLRFELAGSLRSATFWVATLVFGALGWFFSSTQGRFESDVLINAPTVLLTQLGLCVIGQHHELRLEHVGARQHCVEQVLGDDLAKGPRRGSGRLPLVPGALHVAERIRRQVADEGLIGWIGHRLGVGALGSIQTFGHVRVLGDLAAGLGPVTHQVGNVHQALGAVRNDRIVAHAAALPSRVC